MIRRLTTTFELSITTFVAALIFSSCCRSGNPLAVSSKNKSEKATSLPLPLTGDWAGAKSALQEIDCCVVKIPNIDSHLQILQQELAENGPSDIDLRARIRTSSSATATAASYEDCLRVVRQLVTPLPENDENEVVKDPCAMALEELARGIASLAEGSLEEDGGVDVFVRIVCASNYRAREPPFHTDKAPFRGYATLRGVGTEYMTRTCSPCEYMMLRTLGNDRSNSFLQQAQELQFIVMKGDYYYDHCENSKKAEGLLLDNVWTRARACIHRSPPGDSGRRVIVSFDLADGDDDREWSQAGTKREWRNGLTQRKSHLVT
jgi:hypothetical protein